MRIRTILFLIWVIVIFVCSSLLAQTNVVERIEKQTKNIDYETRNYIVKDIKDIEKVGQSASETKSKGEGNCVDSAILVKKIAEKEGLKAEYKIVDNGKHVIVIVRDGVKEYKFSNGKRRF